MRASANPLAATVLPLALMVVIFALSSIPGTIAPDDPAAYRVFLWVPPDVQNVLHVPVFGLLALLWYRAARSWPWPSLPSAALAVALTGAYGWFDEWYQLHVPGRFGTLTDFALDAVGALLGVALGLMYDRRGAQGR